MAHLRTYCAHNEAPRLSSMATPLPNGLRRLRQLHGYTQDELGFMTGRSAGEISRLETERTPLLEDVIAYQLLLGVGVEDLLPELVNKVRGELRSRAEVFKDSLSIGGRSDIAERKVAHLNAFLAGRAIAPQAPDTTSREPKELTRVLAIDPSYGRFGYALIEEMRPALSHQGVINYRGGGATVALAKVRKLLEECRPTVLAVEDVASKDCRKGPQAKQLVRSILAEAKKKRLRAKSVKKTRIHKALGLSIDANKATLADAVAHTFPGLKHVLPPARIANYMQEHYRSSVFDAAAIGLTALIGTCNCMGLSCHACNFKR